MQGCPEEGCRGETKSWISQNLFQSCLQQHSDELLWERSLKNAHSQYAPKTVAVKKLRQCDFSGATRSVIPQNTL